MMVSNQPYLLRAFYDWIVDSYCTPHLLVDATQAGVSVPVEYVQNGRIVLNVAPQAVDGLSIGNEWITFFARFSGKKTYIELPVHAVHGVYAKENGEGVAFQTSMEAQEAFSEFKSNQAIKTLKKKIAKKPTLKIVK